MMLDMIRSMRKDRKLFVPDEDSKEPNADQRQSYEMLKEKLAKEANRCRRLKVQKKEPEKNDKN